MSDKTKQFEGTPGPWEVNSRRFTNRRVFTPDDRIEIIHGIGHIATLYRVNWRADGSVDATNARIISTAPDGVELARLVYMIHNSHPNRACTVEQWEELLTKARAILARVDSTNV